MKFNELKEMTARMVNMNFETMPFPDFPENAKFVGKMEGGLPIYFFEFNKTEIYGVKIKNENAAFTQLKKINVPNLGEIYEVQNSKVINKYRGQILSFKLLFFLSFELKKTLLFGNVHSNGTVNGLKKVEHVYDMKLFNIDTGEIEEFSYEKYISLTSESKRPTEWQVLFLGNKRGVAEGCFGWAGIEHENRSLWTYGINDWPKEDFIV